MQLSLKAKIQQSSTPIFVLYAASAAFMTYFCMYAFRKPFVAASYENSEIFSGVIDFKVALVLAQVLGYLLSKFIGIKVISEMPASKRAISILVLVMSSELALIGFALVPTNYKLLCMFLNGIPLGMIWGLVFSFLEGRRTSEILGAILSITFIVASGVVRSVGKWLITEMNIVDMWMPAATGALFTIPLFISVYLLTQLPKPNAEDIAERQARQPMNASQRKSFFYAYAPGILLLISSFLLITGLRDFRDNFSAEIWTELGYGNEPAIFTYAGIRIALIVLVALGAMVIIKNNVRAFLVNHMFILLGCGLLGGSTLAFQAQVIDGKTWMVLLGAGLYTAYIPYNCFLFDRMISAVGVNANAGFLLYLADSAGYLGSVSILLYRTFSSAQLSWLDFFINLCYFVSVIGACLVACSMSYFSRLLYKQHQSSKKAKPIVVQPQAVRMINTV